MLWLGYFMSWRRHPLSLPTQPPYARAVVGYFIGLVSGACFAPHGKLPVDEDVDEVMDETVDEDVDEDAAAIATRSAISGL